MHNHPSHAYLAHHELASIVTTIIVIITIVIIVITVVFIVYEV